MRTVSSPTQAQAASGANQPCYFIKIEWASLISYLCTHSTRTWNGQSWSGSGVDVGQFDDFGRPRRIVLADPDNAWRTLLLGSGIRDRRITIWQGYVDALAVGDPIEIGVGYGDKGKAAGNRVTIDVGPLVSSRVFTPRERIGPSIGINFVATPGSKVRWNGQDLVMESR
jgi:hypothetical protein